MPSAWTQTHADFFMASLAFQGPSGLPEDQFVNTFVFRNDNVFDRDGMLDAVETALTNFFADPAAGTGDQLVDYMPNRIEAPTCKLFDLGDAPPRVPVERQFTGISPNGAATPYPREVAICASYHNGGPGPRNRGRIFWGPLVTSVGVEESDSDLVRPGSATQGRLIDRMNDMATNPSLECTWVLWSRANNAMHNIVGGWVEDAYDTQRARGTAPTSRTTWGAPIVSGQGGYPGGRPGDTSEWT